MNYGSKKKKREIEYYQREQKRRDKQRMVEHLKLQIARCKESGNIPQAVHFMGQLQNYEFEYRKR